PPCSAPCRSRAAWRSTRASPGSRPATPAAWCRCCAPSSRSSGWPPSARCACAASPPPACWRPRASWRARSTRGWTTARSAATPRWPRPRCRRSPSWSGRRSSALGQIVGLQEGLRHVGGLLLVEVDGRVHRGDRLRGQQLVDRVDHVHELLAAQCGELVLVDDQVDVLEAEHALRVLEHLVLAGGELG